MNGNIGFVISDLFNEAQVASWKEEASKPLSLAEKLKVFENGCRNNIPTRNPRNGQVIIDQASKKPVLQSYLGRMVNNLLNTEFPLSRTGRRQQIKNTLFNAKAYLTDHPDVSIGLAIIQGTIKTCREWTALMGDVSDEQQQAMIYQASKHQKIDPRLEPEQD